jgi:hypothetical protein
VAIKPAKFGDSREIFKSPEFGRFTWRSQLVSITQTNYTVPKSSGYNVGFAFQWIGSVAA